MDEHALTGSPALGHSAAVPDLLNLPLRPELRAVAVPRPIGAVPNASGRLRPQRAVPLLLYLVAVLVAERSPRLAGRRMDVCPVRRLVRHAHYLGGRMAANGRGRRRMRPQLRPAATTAFGTTPPARWAACGRHGGVSPAIVRSRGGTRGWTEVQPSLEGRPRRTRCNARCRPCTPCLR